MRLTESTGVRRRPSVGLKLDQSQISGYLDRIGYGGSTSRTADTLIDLHVAHLLTVPFENLDISAGQYIRLDLPTLFQKIVVQRRGGFCYELNGLFAALLRGLGFRVDHLSAGVARPDGNFGPEFDHLTLSVGAGDAWLVDVGFGDSFLAPIPFMISAEGTLDHAGRFRLSGVGKYHVLERRNDDGEWPPLYRFTFATYALRAFTERCHFQQTSPESHFTQHRICSLARPDGRITLSDKRLIITSGIDRTERELNDDAEFDSILENEFGISLYPTGNAIH